MSSSLILDNIIFTEDELDFEANGTPIILSGFSGPKLIDSYLDGHKLYKPTLTNLLLSYNINLIIDNNKLQQIYNLILNQANIAKEFRTTYNTDTLLAGYKLEYLPDIGSKIKINVWLSNLTKSTSYYNIDLGKEVIKCSLTVEEAE
jgi:hypothetical protein